MTMLNNTNNELFNFTTLKYELNIVKMFSVKSILKSYIICIVDCSKCDKNSARRPGPNGEGGEEAR